MSDRRVRVVVRGRVQGVFFRAECARRARSLGVRGFVRNRDDGSVEAAFEGDASGVEELVRWCGEGPAAARVDAVEARDEPLRGDRDFRVEA